MRFALFDSSLDDLHLPARCVRADTRPGYPALAQADTARAVATELLRTATRFRIALLAYCLMPDHVHIIFAGRSGDADLAGAIARWRQLTGRRHRVRSGRTLWKPRCREWPLTDIAGIRDAAAFIVDEPVRMGLSRRAEHYAWSGAPASISARLASGRPAARPDWWPSAPAGQRLTP
jgi:REP element-mobilizing transposase RayT